MPASILVLDFAPDMPSLYCPYPMKRLLFISMSLCILLLGAWVITQSPAQQSPFSFLDAPVPPTPNQQPTLTSGQKLSDRVTSADLIRVGISDDAMRDQEYDSTRISATGPYQLIDMSTHQVIFQGEAHHPVTITVDRNGFYFREIPASGPVPGPLALHPLNPNDLVQILNITRRKQQPTYRGFLEVHRGFSSPAKLSVINVVNLQDYLKAVVPNELPPRYGYEAVKAQSVAARNYAVRPREKPWPNFDICDSQYCQVYFGAHTEHPSANQALRETHGIVALYDGRPILALYSSAHGGYSENYENSFSDSTDKQFPGTPIPYLKGQPDIPSEVAPFGDLSLEENARRFWTNTNIRDFDVKSSYHRWEKRWNYADLLQTLNEQLIKTSQDSTTKPFLTPHLQPGQSIGQFKRVTVTKRGKSGKAMEVVLDTSRGQFIAQKEFVIRKIFAHGGRMLPSANVVFSHMTDPQGRLVYLKAQGGGFGHGVGMSQLGASTMSSQAAQFDDILQHYYTGVALGTLPLHVGEQPQPTGKNRQPVPPVTRPMRTEFVAPKTSQTATLWVETQQSDSETVTVMLNDKTLVVPAPADNAKASLFPSNLWQHRDPQTQRRQIPISPSHLRMGQLNSLVLYPSSNSPQKPIKAWLELIPPKSGK